MRFVIPDLYDPNAYPRAVRRAVGRQAAAVRQAWRDHNARIRPLLSPALQRLQETPLHDGLIQSVHIDPGQGTLRLRLLCDDADGYFDLTLDYKNIQLTPAETSLLCLIAHAYAEVDRDELDLVPNCAVSAAFIHRLSWHTGVETGREATGLNALGEETFLTHHLHPELELRFGGFEMQMTRRQDRRLARAHDYITIVRDPNEIAEMDSVAATL